MIKTPDSGLRRNDAGWLAACLLLAAVLVIGALIAQLGTPSCDRTLAEAAAAGRAYRRFWLSVTHLGAGDVRVAVGLLAAALLWMRRRGRDGLILVSIAVLQTGANSLLKDVFDRVRPSLHPHLDHVWDPSFPSGHSAQSAALYLSIALLTDRRLLWLAVPLVGLIGVSRVVLGVHWPSDVAAGWAEGAAFALIALQLSRRFGSGRNLPALV